MNKQEPEDKLKENKEGFNKFAKFSSMAIEMGVMIFLGAFGGNWLDKHFETEKPWFTIGLSLFAVIGSIYLVIKKVMDASK